MVRNPFDRVEKRGVEPREAVDYEKAKNVLSEATEEDVDSDARLQRH